LIISATHNYSNIVYDLVKFHLRLHHHNPNFRYPKKLKEVCKGNLGYFCLLNFFSPSNSGRIPKVGRDGAALMGLQKYFLNKNILRVPVGYGEDVIHSH